MTIKARASFLQAEANNTAGDLRRLVYGLLAGRGGIVGADDLKVTQRATPGLFVSVAGGRAFVPGTEGTYQGVYFVENEGNTDVAIATPHATNPRRDLIVARVNDAEFSGSASNWAIASITGTPAASPSVPSTPNNAVVLAEVYVAANATTILNANITDRRTSRATGAGGIVVCTSTNRPTATEGQFAYELDTDRLVVHNGTSWSQVYPATTGGIADGSITDAKIASVSSAKLTGSVSNASVAVTGNIGAGGSIGADGYLRAGNGLPSWRVQQYGGTLDANGYAKVAHTIPNGPFGPKAMFAQASYKGGGGEQRFGTPTGPGTGTPVFCVVDGGDLHVYAGGSGANQPFLAAIMYTEHNATW